ncbi:MAG: YdcF family protein [Oscillospiraceae bacterium]|nr:YdcF family protein [Oscillospiraceae bacterium]
MKDNTLDKQSGKLRRIIGSILLLFMMIFTVYLSAVMLHRIHTVVLKDTYRTIFHNELILCGILLLFSLDLRFDLFTRPPLRIIKALGWILRIAVIILSLVIVFFFGKVIAGSLLNAASEAEHVIVLGMALEDGQPTRDLILRLDTAQRYLEEHPDTTLILTGGNPDQYGRTEAFVMKELLAERGVSEESLILEDRAESTRQNFKNAAEIIDPAEPVVLVSSNYHMDRAVSIAREAGFTGVMRLPAPSDPLRYGANVMWEVVLELNELKSSRRPS